MDKKRFGLFIKESRLKKNLTQQELADLLYLDVTAISKWERGISYPDITMIPDICKYLEINEHELIESSKDSEYRKMKKDAKTYNNIKDAVFIIPTILYLVAIFVCFIVNVAVNHTLSWFWLVLTACLCGFTFLPTVSRFFNKKKLLMFVGSTMASLFILFLTCSLYTKNYWFMVATLGTLLGYVMLFFPIFFVRQRNYLGIEKYNKYKKYFLLIYSFLLLIGTILLLLSINVYMGIDFKKALVITLYCFSILFAFGLIELFNINRLFKTSVYLIISDFYLYGLGNILSVQLDGKAYNYQINLGDWVNYNNGNTAFIIILSLTIASIILFVFGLKKNKK